MVQLAKVSVIVALAVFCQASNLVLTNDDGWAAANIRATFDSLVDAGHHVILSAPAENKSGSGSSSATPKRVEDGCQYHSCPPGSPAQGADPHDDRLNYVNAYPVDSVRYGIKTLARKSWGGNPDFVVSGPNVGSNIGSVVNFSGTVGAACEAALEGIPSTAFSGGSGKQVSYTVLEDDPDSKNARAARIYAELVQKYTNALLSSSARPILPHGITVNVNLPHISGCEKASDFEFVLSRIHSSSGSKDVKTCGSTKLPLEDKVYHSEDGCFASVSVMNATTKSDVDASTQAFVLNRLGSLLSCLPSK